MIYQKLDSRKIHHFLSGFIGLLIVSCEPSESVKSGECSFHDPSKKFGCKALGSVGSVLTSTDQGLWSGKWEALLKTDRAALTGAPTGFLFR